MVRGGGIEDPPPLIDGLQDGPRGRSIAFRRAPREPQESPHKKGGANRTVGDVPATALALRVQGRNPAHPLLASGHARHALRNWHGFRLRSGATPSSLGRERATPDTPCDLEWIETALRDHSMHNLPHWCRENAAPALACNLAWTETALGNHPLRTPSGSERAPGGGSEMTLGALNWHPKGRKMVQADSGWFSVGFFPWGTIKQTNSEAD